jgi:hypothetical protein
VEWNNPPTGMLSRSIAPEEETPKGIGSISGAGSVKAGQ